MANNNQGKRIGSGSFNLAPGTQKKTDQTLQSVLQQQLDKSVTSDTKSNTTNNTRSNLFVQLRGYLDTLIQKVSTSNESFSRTEKLITNLSKKIDSALIKIEQNNKKPVQNAEDSTKKLIEIFTKNFSKDDIQRIIASTDSINSKITELLQKNNELSYNSSLKNQQTENAILTFLKENETTNKQFVDKFNTSLQEFKTFVTSIYTVSQESNKDAITSVKDIKAILTQFQVNIESINNKLVEYKSDFKQNFSSSSERFVNATEELTKTILTSNEDKIKIDTQFYNKIEQFFQDLQKKNNEVKTEVKVLKETKILEKQIMSLPKQQKPVILPNKSDEHLANITSIINADFKKIRESLLEVSNQDKKQNIVYINQNRPANQTKTASTDSINQTKLVEPKHTTIYKNINVNSSPDSTKNEKTVTITNAVHQIERNNIVPAISTNTINVPSNTQSNSTLLNDEQGKTNKITPKYISIADQSNKNGSSLIPQKVDQATAYTVSTKFMHRNKST